MRDLAVLFLHLLVTVARLAGPGGALRKRQATVSEAVKAIGWKAQLRLHGRYRKLLGRGKCQQQVITAVGRELLGFIWAIGVTVERQQRKTSSSIAA